MKVCIIQPSYIPWKGYFHQIAKSDIFIFLDTVQYDRRGWRNRNKIKTPQGPSWLTIPVQAHGSHDGLLIKNVQIQDDQWANSHIEKIRLNYLKSPYFPDEFPWLKELLLSTAKQYTNISRISAETTQLIARQIGLKNHQFIYASDLAVKTDNSSTYILKLVQAVEGSAYLSGPSAQNYLDTKLFDDAGIPVEWMRYDYAEYPQLYPPFTHQVSIIDLIFMVGSKAVLNTILNQRAANEIQQLSQQKDNHIWHRG